GAATASADWLLFVDAGVELHPAALDALGRLAAPPSVGLVAPRVRSTPGPGLLERYEVASSPLDLGPRPSTVRPGGRVGYVPSAALLVRRVAFVEVGGFDARLRYGEDVDLVWRLVAAGW